MASGRAPAVEHKDAPLLVVRAELLTANMLAWLAMVQGEGELSTDAHVYLFERYQRLADHHRRHGHRRRAERLQRKADAHRDYFDGGDPPLAAAMALPRPRRWIVTDAVSRTPRRPPRDVA